ncbi:hypothetical protein EG347_05485 [Chryseobacterium sp. G0186]|nr:hypothetical protein EG347_05485 [Chryseobacterium sp. G0186]
MDFCRNSFFLLLLDVQKYGFSVRDENLAFMIFVVFAFEVFSIDFYPCFYDADIQLTLICEIKKPIVVLY